MIIINDLDARLLTQILKIEYLETIPGRITSGVADYEIWRYRVTSTKITQT